MTYIDKRKYFSCCCLLCY